MHAPEKPINAPVPSTLAEAYRDYCQTVARWAWHLGGPDVEIEDAVQEIFLVVSRQMASFRAEARFSSWLYAITRKVVANHRRRHRWRFWRDRNPGTLERLPSAGLDPYAQLEQQQARLQFYRVLDQLPEKYRTVLVMFELVPATPAPPAPAPAARLAMVESQPQPVASVAVRPEGGEHWLAEALHSLRTDHAPVAALALLDLHAAELGQSALVHEVMLLRVEALLELKRSGEALALLDGKSLSNVAASRSLLLTRAELRAAAGRCADGLADFDLLLARARQPDEQSLYGRAVCRSRTGDKLGAQADFHLYRRRFPNGAHIRDVEKQLAGGE